MSGYWFRRTSENVAFCIWQTHYCQKSVCQALSLILIFLYKKWFHKILLIFYTCKHNFEVGVIQLLAGLTPCSQTVGSLFRTPGWLHWQQKTLTQSEFSEFNVDRKMWSTYFWSNTFGKVKNLNTFLLPKWASNIPNWSYLWLSFWWILHWRHTL